MELITMSEPRTCVAASLAMVLDVEYTDVFDELFLALEYPFDPPWETYPKVPSMEAICEWAWFQYGTGLVPFPKNPMCSPSLACSPVPVWEDGNAAFERHLRYGRGMLEGITGAVGHMCAWDGKEIYDPRGHIYPLEHAPLFKFEPTRFWLCT